MKPTSNSEQGFTLLEIMMVVAILAVMAGMAIGISPAFVRQARAESGLTQAIDVFRSAREMAISQRRNVSVQFLGQDVIRTQRVEIVAAGPPVFTTLRTVQLENRMRFQLTPGLPDTPDLFGNAAAIAFGPTATRMFTSDGSFVDANGDVLNGTLFLAIPNQGNSARAITVFGPTGLMRTWSWNGREWQ